MLSTVPFSINGILDLTKVVPVRKQIWQLVKTSKIPFEHTTLALANRNITINQLDRLWNCRPYLDSTIRYNRNLDFDWWYKKGSLDTWAEKHLVPWIEIYRLGKHVIDETEILFAPGVQLISATYDIIFDLIADFIDVDIGLEYFRIPLLLVPENSCRERREVINNHIMIQLYLILLLWS